MNREDMIKHVETLIEKAAKAELSNEAMMRAQAALNAANALAVITNLSK